MAIFKTQRGITLLTLATAIIHLGLGFAEGDTLFILNGVGFLILLYVSFSTPGFLKAYKSLIRWAFIGFTLLTILAYFAIWGIQGLYQTVGMLSKTVELLLVIALWQTRDN